MTSGLAGALALILYGMGIAFFAQTRRGPALASTLGALAGHAVVLATMIVATRGVNFGIVNAASIVGWCIASIIWVLNLQRPLESLAVFVLPMTGLALGLDLWLPPPPIAEHPLPLGMYLHIALAIIAYSLFMIAAAQALLLTFATRQLRHHHPVMHFLPPLPTMEAVMFQLTAFAFGLLTASLIFGALFVQNIRSQHLSHKIVFSGLAWLVFATLVHGRWRWNWRGRHGVKYVVSGSILLALAFFGTKVVLELILRRT